MMLNINLVHPCHAIMNSQDAKYLFSKLIERFYGLHLAVFAFSSLQVVRAEHNVPFRITCRVVSKTLAFDEAVLCVNVLPSRRLRCGDEQGQAIE